MLTAVNTGSVMPVQAANIPVNGGVTTFEKYLTMDEKDNVPNVTFGFTIAIGYVVSGN